MPSIAAMAIAAHESGHAIQDAVEFNASKRALEQLEQLGLLGEQEREGARAVLRSAALTYVAGGASAAGYIIYLAFLGGRWFVRKPPVGAPPFKPPPAA